MQMQSNDVGRSNKRQKSSKRASRTSAAAARIIILGGRSQYNLPATEGNGMKIDRAHIPTLPRNNEHNNNKEEPIFTITQWNTFCDIINNSLQIYNVVIQTHSKKVVSRIVILPIASFTLIAVILIIFGRPFVGLGLFASILVASLCIFCYDRCRVDRAYDRAIWNLKRVVQSMNEEGVLLQDCGVVLSVVMTGHDDDDDVSDDEDNMMNRAEQSSKKNITNDITNVYIECKRISESARHHEYKEYSDSQKQQRNAIENDGSFSC